MLNIPSTVNDPNYRYKMPKMNLKIQSKGNGIKTNIVNLGDVAKHLQTSEQYILKYFGFQKASQTITKETSKNSKTYIINGSFTEEEMTKTLDKFIEKYICCPRCKYPEMHMFIKNEKINGKCDSCPYVGELDNKNKIAAFIIKNPPIQIAKKTEKQAQQGKNTKAQKPKKSEDNDGEDENTEISFKSHFAGEQIEFGSKQMVELIEMVKKFIESRKNEDLDIASAQLVTQLKPLHLKKPLYAYILFNSFFTVNITKQLESSAKLYKNLMKKLVLVNTQLQTILNLEYLLLEVNKEKDFSKFIPTILMKIFQHQLISEEFVTEWDRGLIKDIQKNFLFVPARDHQFRTLGKQFIDWCINEKEDQEEQQEQEIKRQKVKDDIEEKNEEKVEFKVQFRKQETKQQNC